MTFFFRFRSSDLGQSYAHAQCGTSALTLNMFFPRLRQMAETENGSQAGPRCQKTGQAAEQAISPDEKKKGFTLVCLSVCERLCVCPFVSLFACMCVLFVLFVCLSLSVRPSVCLSGLPACLSESMTSTCQVEEASAKKSKKKLRAESNDQT